MKLLKYIFYRKKLRKKVRKKKKIRKESKKKKDWEKRKKRKKKSGKNMKILKYYFLWIYLFFYKIATLFDWWSSSISMQKSRNCSCMVFSQGIYFSGLELFTIISTPSFCWSKPSPLTLLLPIILCDKYLAISSFLKTQQWKNAKKNNIKHDYSNLLKLELFWQFVEIYLG